MLEHLLDFDPLPTGRKDVTFLDDADADALLAAQHDTAAWLEKMGAPVPGQAEALAAQNAARNAFAAVIAAQPDEAQKAALTTLKTPLAVRHLVGMLTSYDWEFVEQAKELRGYAVSQILEETKNPDPRIRLRALELLGKVTEVALFTDRVEVKRTELKDDDLDAKIKEKLSRFTHTLDVTVTEVPQEGTTE